MIDSTSMAVLAAIAAISVAFAVLILGIVVV